MEFSTKATEIQQAEQVEDLLTTRSECLVVGVFEKPLQETLFKKMDALSDGLLSRLLKNGDIKSQVKTHTLLHAMPGIHAERILFFGLGKQDECTKHIWLQCLDHVIAHLAQVNAQNALWVLPPASGEDLAWAVGIASQRLQQACYQFFHQYPELRSSHAHQDTLTVLKKVSFVCSKKEQKNVRETLNQSTAINEGVLLTRNLANLPSNICTPKYLAEQAQQLATAYKMKLEILEKKQLQSLKMGAFLAVAQGANSDPKFIILHYQGAANKKQAPIVLVGKGITFDSGGISLKPGDAMDEMKFDMCGAATVLGALSACARLGLKQNIIGVIPACENMPSGCAVKPGDVVTSLSGQTIEVLNTDAEGRLILCDALSYVERFNPELVIDMATLTGACVVALGHVNSGLFSHDDTLAQQLLMSGKKMLDPVWRLPLEEAYQEQLRSNFADMANIGGRAGGSITAACFLERFTKKYRWAHLDIAGTAWKSGKKKGATGRPVPLIVRFLVDYKA